MATASGFEFAIVAVTQQSIVVRVCFDVYVAAMAAVTTGGTASRNVLLPAKCDAAVAAVAGFHHDFCFVSKHR